MRRQAEAEPLPPDVPLPTYHPGTAEATGLADGCADAVLAAQAMVPQLLSEGAEKVMNQLHRRAPAA